MSWFTLPSPTQQDGSGVTDWLRAFNDRRDDFIIELSVPLLMLGFVAGTVDVFTGSGLSQQSWFAVTWGIIQALAIDGLFFAVWSKVRHHPWSRTTWFQGVVLVTVGLLLSMVASLVNNILTYQELNHVSNLAQVMGKLGIDAGLFSYGRSILVVLISILVALVARGEGVSVRHLQAQASEDQATISRLETDVTGLRARLQAVTEECRQRTDEANRLREEVNRLRDQLEVTRNTVTANPSVTVPEHQQRRESEPEPSQPKAVRRNRVSGSMATDNGQTMTIQQNGKTVTATGGYRELIKEAMLRLVEEHQEIRYPVIAEMTGVNLSTIKKHGPSLKEEVLVLAAPVQELEEQDEARAARSEQHGGVR